MNEADFRIRLLKKDEGSLLKDIRLRALKDSPNSFGQKHQEVDDKPLSFWRQKAIEVNEMNDRITILAMDDKKAIGMLYCFIGDAEQKIGGLGGMWVDPEYRKKGIGRAMINFALGWQRGKGMKKLTFWNTEGNKASDQFYRRLGFAYTGKKRPLESNPSLNILEMIKML